MNNKRPALWFGVYGKKYEGKEPAFFDEKNLPWIETLKEIYPRLKEGLLPLIHEDDNNFTPYFESRLQFPPNNWKTLHFYIWGWRSHAHLNKVPVMKELVKIIPDLISASFSLLEPHSRILPHSGDTNAIYRVHLGIKIPAGLPQCGFIVNGEARSWQEGEVLTFLDANTHEAFNESNERRYILTMDIVRPEFATKKKYVCIKILSILSLYRIEAHTKIFSTIQSIIFGGKSESAKPTPKLLINVLLSPFIFGWFFFLPVYNALDFKSLLRIKQT